MAGKRKALKSSFKKVRFPGSRIKKPRDNKMNEPCGYCNKYCGNSCSDWEDGRFELDVLTGEIYSPVNEMPERDDKAERAFWTQEYNKTSKIADAELEWRESQLAQPIDMQLAYQNFPKCLECNDTGVTLSERACGFCSAFDNLFEVCGNCDISALIPEGKTADDCVCCNGKGWVKKC